MHAMKHRHFHNTACHGVDIEMLSSHSLL